MKKLASGLLLLLVIGMVGTIVSLKANGGFSFDTYNVSDKKTVNGENIEEVEIDSSSSDVKVVPTDEKEISIELSGKVSKKLKRKLQLDVVERGNKLEVALKGENQLKFNIGVLIVDTNINVYLPEKVYQSIKVETSSGSNEIDSLKAKELSLRTSSGDLLARDSVAEDTFIIQSSSGEVDLKNNKANIFDVKVSSGSLYAVDLDGKESTFHSSSGEISLKNVIGEIVAEASSGEIIIDNEETTGNMYTETSSGDVSVAFDKKPTSLAIDFKGNSGEGNVEIKGLKYDEKSEDNIIGQIGSGQYKLKVRTSSGDFELK
ncbi:DUF4097 family beta strand repeat-containing protein [Bacillus massilinigeriensis]|uniref:DUF4097 family beta strand repeat-containing protein n=1 Tax=Bacillus massilionigeriensis TaxID=1805475 RepID=UPI00096B563A|nr:DUF4097 family beta strand repeat-containing protein [Bacillus massilionigeriensis]